MGRGGRIRCRRGIAEGLERRSISNGNIVDAEGGGFEESGGRCGELVDGDTGGPACFDTQECVVNGDGVGALGGIEAGIAAAHGESVGFA